MRVLICSLERVFGAGSEIALLAGAAAASLGGLAGDVLSGAAWLNAVVASRSRGNRREHRIDISPYTRHKNPGSRKKSRGTATADRVLALSRTSDCFYTLFPESPPDRRVRPLDEGGWQCAGGTGSNDGYRVGGRR